MPPSKTHTPLDGKVHDETPDWVGADGEVAEPAPTVGVGVPRGCSEAAPKVPACVVGLTSEYTQTFVVGSPCLRHSTHTTFGNNQPHSRYDCEAHAFYIYTDTVNEYCTHKKRTMRVGSVMTSAEYTHHTTGPGGRSGRQTLSP